MKIVAWTLGRRIASYPYTSRDGRRLSKPSAILLGAAVAWIAWAQAAAEPATPEPDAPPALRAVPEPPEIPPRVKSGETLEPEITIRRGEERTVTEYRVNGQLQYIKVEPTVGPIYWLVDTTGNGIADTRYYDYDPQFATPSWVIFRW